MTADEVLNLVTIHGNRELTEQRIIQAMKDYARYKCTEQRKICGRVAWGLRYELPADHDDVLAPDHAVEHSPEPEFG